MSTLMFKASDLGTAMQKEIMDNLHSAGVPVSPRALEDVTIDVTLDSLNQANSVAQQVMSCLKCAQPKPETSKGLLNKSSSFLEYFWDALYHDPVFASMLPSSEQLCWTDEAIKELVNSVVISFQMKRGVLSDKAEKKFIEIFSECAIKYLDTNTESIVLDQIKHSENVPHAQKVNYNELSDDIKGIVQKKLKAENLTLYDSCTNGIQVWVYSSPENYTEAKNNKLISIIADSLKTSVFKTKNEQRKLMDTFAKAVGSGSVATIRTAVTKHIEVELKRVNAETLTAITSLIPLDASSIKINTKEDNGKTTLIIDYVVDCGIANVK